MRRAQLLPALALTALAALFLLPVWSLLITSFTPEGYIFTQGSALWPAHFTLANFADLLDTYPFARWYLNSAITSSLFAVGQVFSCSITAFALVRLTFRGRQVALLLILATMMLPFQVLMLPMFLEMKTVGWLDSLLPLIVPAFFGDVTGAFGIFLLRQAFLQIPSEYADAAMVDGANPWQLFRHIYFPMARPYIAVIAVFSFMSSWNDFIRPIIYITNPDVMTVTGGLSFFQTQFYVSWGLLMAGAMLAMLPTLALYLVAQRYFVQMSLGVGIKG